MLLYLIKIVNGIVLYHKTTGMIVGEDKEKQLLFKDEFPNRYPTLIPPTDYEKIIDFKLNYDEKMTNYSRNLLNYSNGQGYSLGILNDKFKDMIILYPTNNLITQKRKAVLLHDNTFVIVQKNLCYTYNNTNGHFYLRSCNDNDNANNKFGLYFAALKLKNETKENIKRKSKFSSKYDKFNNSLINNKNCRVKRYSIRLNKQVFLNKLNNDLSEINKIVNSVSCV